MNCSSCTHDNPAGAKFCEECGTPIGVACANCGTELRATVKFCSECGTPVAASGAPPSPASPAALAPASSAPLPETGTRKIVTIVFADLAGSTAMQERLDPESVRRFMESYYDAMREAVESHGGTVTQFLGDGVKAVFGIPRVAEDDAIRAVRAGMAMQESFQALAESQRGAVGAVGLRIAVNTGEVVANADDEIIGDPVNVAARLQEQGGNGDVVIGDSTARLVEALVTLAPLGSFALKGRAETVAAFLVESLDPPASAATAAFVGRDEELVRLTLVYENAIEKPATSLAVLVGSPGLGKSRLIDEFARRLGDTAQIIESHCDSANAATFAPLAVALRALLDIEAGAKGDGLKEPILAAIPEDDRDRERIATGVAALLAGSPGSLEETFFVVRRLFASLASERPLVLVIDDLQWAEPLLLDLVEHLVQWGSGVQMLVLVGARPELRDKRASLTIPGGLVSDVVTLSGLDAGAAMRLAANVVGAESLPAAVAAKVLATSEGNPLFVGELVRMLVHEGALKLEGDRWTTGTALAALAMPPTIHALLAARIERLQPDERLVLERASVVGRQFSRSAVLELLPGAGADLDTQLETLLRSELIERDSGWFFGEPVLRFHHVLIRDAAYRQLLKGTRAELHARFADWAVARAEGSAEHDETIGWHLEQAHQLLSELGPIDASGRVIGERASTHLAAAGGRALAGDDVSLAASLLGRAIARLDPDDEARAELALDWCEALLAAGDVGPAVAAIAELDRFVGDSERLRAWHTCFAGQHTVLTAPEGLQTTADTVAAAADSLASLDDAAGEAKAHFVYALALSSLGRIGACEAALDRALAAARRVAGDRRRANTVLAIAPLAALSGPSPVTRASGRCLDVVRVLRITQGAPAVEAVALSCQGVLEALRGRTEAARRMIASARTMVEELGITQRLLEVDVFSGQVDLLEGDASAAEASLRSAYEGLRELGLGIDAAQAAALLARALLAQDRHAEAETLSHESEALAGDDLKAAIAWRGVRAEALARRGEHAAAVDFANKAVEIAAATDALLDHADARLALATALRAAGRVREANAEERRAHELWEAKGATLLAERARGNDAREEPTTSPAEEAVAQRPAARSRVRANAATALLARFNRKVAARDLVELRAEFGDSYREIHHPTGSTFGPDEAVASLGRLLNSRDPYYEAVPLATLGDSLVLTTRRTGASGAVSQNYDVGAYENQMLQVVEVNELGTMQRGDVFLAEHLNQALACLYERYAEAQPTGPDRSRAEAVARSVVAWTGPVDLDRMAAAIEPSAPLVDHRVLATWASPDGAALLQHFRLQLELAADFMPRVEDILAIEPNALLFRSTYHGHANASGGYLENRVCVAFVCGDDGRVCHIEVFEAEAEAHALERFDTLIAQVDGSRGIRPAVHPNRVTEFLSRVGRAVAARDLDAVRALVSESHSAIEHATGASLGPDGGLASLERLLRANDAYFEFAPLATLGDSLALAQRRAGASGTVSTDFDVGPHEIESFNVLEVDSRGLLQHSEVFGETHLADAVTHLYERYAELLPEGEARDRAATSARAVGNVFSGQDPETISSIWSPNAELVDHRILGQGVISGADDMREWAHAMREVEDFTIGLAGVLRIQPNAALVQTRTQGTARASGGAYERLMWAIWIFGSDGFLTRLEFFDVGSEAEAIARFDALTSPAPESTPFANTASRASDRILEHWLGRDWQGLSQLITPDYQLLDRRRMVLVDLDREAYLESVRVFGEVESTRIDSELVATRGDRLALMRDCLLLEGGDVGPSEVTCLKLIETNDRGEPVTELRFDPSDEDAAYAELDARFRAGEGAAHPQLVETQDTLFQRWQDHDWEGMEAACAPGFVYRDHRLLGFGTMLDDAAKFARSQQALVELAPDSRTRLDHLRISVHGALRQLTQYGTRDGGAFETPFISNIAVDAQGRIASVDSFDVDKAAQAFAHFRGLGAGAAAPETRFANVATRAAARNEAAWIAKDWDRFAGYFPPEFRLSERRRDVQLELSRDDAVAFLRSLGEHNATSNESETLATRGERLALLRRRLTIAGDEAGPSEIVHLNLMETDENGTLIARVCWDLDELEAAYAELDARFDAGEGAAYPRTWGLLRDFVQGVANRDWDSLPALCSPELAGRDHRSLAVLGTIQGPEAFVAGCRAMIELAPDTIFRVHHFLPEARGYYIPGGWCGTRDGSNYELPINPVVELDELGRIARIDIYDDGDPAALERLAELADAKTSPWPFPNKATGQLDRFVSAWHARDWARIEALFSADMRQIDRRDLMHLELDRSQHLESLRFSFQMTSSRFTNEILATRGDHLDLGRMRLEFSDEDAGPSELEYLAVSEVDARGDMLVLVRFNADDLDGAYEELEARYQAREAKAHPAGLARYIEAARLRETRDFSALVGRHTPDLVCHDHRLLGWGTLHGPAEFIRTQQVLVDLAPDTSWRLHHAAIAERGALMSAVASGTRDGGSFELAFCRVEEVDATGKIKRIDLYDADDHVAALARFAELSAGTPTSQSLENDATRASDRLFAAWVRKDWDGFAAGFSTDLHLSDRRRFVQLELDREDAITFFRSFGEEDATNLVPETIAIRGERLALRRLRTQITGDGDAGPSESVHLNVFELDGQGSIQKMLRWDDDRLDEALADIDARFSAIESSRNRDPRAVIEKPVAASAATDRFSAAVDVGLETGEWDAIRQICAPGFVYEDRRRIALLSGDCELMVASLRERAAVGAQIELRLMGTAGDRVAVQRVLWSGGPSDGRFEIEYLSVTEVDEAGLMRAIILIDLDDPSAAQNEAWERWAAIDPNVTAVVTRFITMLEAFNEQDVGNWRAELADELVVDDHRLAGMGRIDGADAYAESIVALWELAPVTRADAGWFWPAFDHYGGVTVLRRTGSVPEGGGDFESEYLFLLIVERSLVTRIEMFDMNALDEALARFKELGADPLLLPPNAAARAKDAVTRASRTGDWNVLRGLARSDFRFEDRGRRALVTGDVETWIGSASYVTTLPGVKIKTPMIGTVGDSVAIDVLHWSGSPDGDAFEVERVRVLEADGEGRYRTVILFDLEDRRAAFDEANARFAVGEAAGAPAQFVINQLLQAWAPGDWDEPDVARRLALFAEDIAIEDHRRLSFGRMTRDDWVQSVRVMQELAPDTYAESLRTLAWNESGRVWMNRLRGTRDGGEFETLAICLAVADATCVRSFEAFEIDDAERAIARFHELCADSANEASERALLAVFENSATRVVQKAAAAFEARDLERFASLFAPEFRNFDRRALLQIESDRETWIESHRQILEMTTSRPEYSVLATRGERLALVRMLWQGAEGDVGPSEIDWLLVIEVDEHGAHSAVVAFDPHDLDAAYEELDARWAAGEAALHPRASAWMAAFQSEFADRNWSAMAALTAQDQVAVNHRLVGWGTLSGQGAWVPTLEALVELAADTQVRIQHLRTHRWGFLCHWIWLGSRDGGAYEIPQALVLELNEQGLQTRLDLWDDDKFDEAVARFESFAGDDPRARIAKPIASSMIERWLPVFAQCAETGDWDPLRALLAPDLTFEDRQRRAMVSGDGEMVIASLIERVSTGASPSLELIGNAGDRVEVIRMLWQGGPPDGRFEIEYLVVNELDAAGLTVATILFDADDRRAAQREAWARWAAIDARALPYTTVLGEMADAFNAQDAARWREFCADDLIVEDHRHTGMGRLEGVDAYVESLVALWDLAPDNHLEAAWFCPAMDSHAALFDVRRTGTIPGGGDFESENLSLLTITDGLICRAELFETDALDTALARFEELRPDPSRIPENAVRPTLVELHRLRTAGDFAGIRELAAGDFCFDDRKKQSLVKGGIDELVNALQFLAREAGALLETQPIAIAGDRLALDRAIWRERPGEGPFEIESLRVAEVDEAGKLRAFVFFDPEDLSAAHAELAERNVATGAEDSPVGAIEVGRALNAHDLVRVRASLCDDFYIHDRRRTGLGLVEGAENYIESVAALLELIPDCAFHELYTPARANHGRVTVVRRGGRNTEGGEVESVLVIVTLYRDEKVSGMEFFELEQFDEAIARLEELGPK